MSRVSESDRKERHSEPYDKDHAAEGESRLKLGPGVDQTNARTAEGKGQRDRSLCFGAGGASSGRGALRKLPAHPGAPHAHTQGKHVVLRTMVSTSGVKTPSLDD